MSDPPGVVGAASGVSKALIGALPPGFVALLLVNTIFIGAVMWFLDEQLDQRIKLLNRILDACLAKGAS